MGRRTNAAESADTANRFAGSNYLWSRDRQRFVTVHYMDNLLMLLAGSVKTATLEFVNHTVQNQVFSEI